MKWERDVAVQSRNGHMANVDDLRVQLATERQAREKAEERLDWLEANENLISAIEPPSCFPGNAGWAVWWNTDIGRDGCVMGRTIREALDNFRDAATPGISI